MLFRPVDRPGGRGVVSESRPLTIEKPIRKAVLWACLQTAEPGVTLIAVAFSCAAGGLARGQLHAGIELSAGFEQDPRRQITCIRVADFQTAAPGTLREALGKLLSSVSADQQPRRSFIRPAAVGITYAKTPSHREIFRVKCALRRTARREPMLSKSRCSGAHRGRRAREFAVRLPACLSVPDSP